MSHIDHQFDVISKKKKITDNPGTPNSQKELKIHVVSVDKLARFIGFNLYRLQTVMIETIFVLFAICIYTYRFYW